MVSMAYLWLCYYVLYNIYNFITSGTVSGTVATAESMSICLQ